MAQSQPQQNSNTDRIANQVNQDNDRITALASDDRTGVAVLLTAPRDADRSHIIDGIDETTRELLDALNRGENQ